MCACACVFRRAQSVKLSFYFIFSTPFIGLYFTLERTQACALGSLSSFVVSSSSRKKYREDPLSMHDLSNHIFVVVVLKT